MTELRVSIIFAISVFSASCSLAHAADEAGDPIDPEVTHESVESLQGRDDDPLDIRWRFEAEISPIWVDKNEFEDPKGSGNFVDIKTLDQDGTFTGRISFVANVSKDHYFSYTFAPQQFNDYATITEPVTFQGVTFDPAGEPVRTRMYFYQHRFRWRYEFYPDEDLTMQAGAGIDVIDFETNILQPDRRADVREIIIDPQVYGRIGYKVSPRWLLFTEADLSTWGDIFAEWWSGARWQINPQWDLSFGARLTYWDHEEDTYQHEMFLTGYTFAVGYSWK